MNDIDAMKILGKDFDRYIKENSIKFRHLVFQEGRKNYFKFRSPYKRELAC